MNNEARDTRCALFLVLHCNSAAGTFPFDEVSAHAVSRPQLPLPVAGRPADLLGARNGVLILGWYVLVETGSVLLLTLFGALLFVGTLIAPMLGVASDRIGPRNLLCAMRAVYAPRTTLMPRPSPARSP